MATTFKMRTIQFYEVMQVTAGEQLRMEPQDWTGFQGAIEGADLGSRTIDADRSLIGQTYPHTEGLRFLLHKVRGEGDWLSTVDFNTEEIAEIETAQGQGLLDSTAIFFLPFGNVVALMQGSVAAPSHRSLETYLRAQNPFGVGDQLAVRPLVEAAELDRLKKASQVGRVEIKLGATHVKALKGKKSSLARFIRGSSRFGDVDVTVIISVPRGRKHSESRYELYEGLSDLSDVLPDAAKSARATLFYGPEDALSAGRVTELVEHNITAKRRVAAVNDEGESIRFGGAFVVMDTAIEEMQDQLMTAVEAD